MVKRSENWSHIYCMPLKYWYTQENISKKKSGKKQPFQEIVLYCFQVERLLWLGIWGWWYGWNLAGYEGCGKRYVEPTNQKKKLVMQIFFVDIAIFDFSQSTPCQVWRMGEWSGRCGASPSDGVTRREWRVASERGSPPQEVRGTPNDAATRGTNAATGSRKKTTLPAKEIGGVNQQSLSARNLCLMNLISHDKKTHVKLLPLYVFVIYLNSY